MFPVNFASFMVLMKFFYYKTFENEVLYTSFDSTVLLHVLNYIIKLGHYMHFRHNLVPAFGVMWFWTPNKTKCCFALIHMQVYQTIYLFIYHKYYCYFCFNLFSVFIPNGVEDLKFLLCWNYFICDDESLQYLL